MSFQEHWRAVVEHAARENDRDKLAELLVEVNRLLDIIEKRLVELDDSTNQD